MDGWQVTGFYPYTSTVLYRILEQNHNYKTEEHDFLDTIGEHFQKEAEEKGCNWENKVVMEITSTDIFSIVPVKLYLGKHDGKWSLGLGLDQDKWLKNSNKSFPLKPINNEDN